MRSGTKLEQGEIVLVSFPFSDLSSAKRRPALVISNDRYNAVTEDIVTCGMTSNLAEAEFSVIIDNEDLLEGTLPVRSRVKVDKIFTLEQSLIRKRLGRVNRQLFDSVRRELLRLI